jgi:hypothetical protein
MGAVFTERRALGPIEARLSATTGVALPALAALFAVFPQAPAFPLAALAAWAGVALLYRGYALHRRQKKD